MSPLSVFFSCWRSTRPGLCRIALLHGINFLHPTPVGISYT
uniref:Uncharacterized protein n=1 Tax=Rhizophora mucronata TaxID=61149 RepID=A0A2P2QFK5_RHIMU